MKLIDAEPIIKALSAMKNEIGFDAISIYGMIKTLVEEQEIEKGVVPMIKVDGYKAFRGSIRVTPVNGNAPYTLTGDCLYKPENDCWYIQQAGKFCTSVPSDICEMIEGKEENKL